MRIMIAAAVVMASLSDAKAQVVIETVMIGNPGNAGENSGESEPGGLGPDRICGAVDYVYNIGKFEITAGQYTEFLNAVAATDTYELYFWGMSGGPRGHGCRIQQTGSPGNYTYLVDEEGDGIEDPDLIDRPVNYVDWGSAARFCNWLHNGQPTGAQDLSTTEDGSYYLNGEMTHAGLAAIVREPDATWVIPSEDEWYKAAYHKNDGATGNYYDYATHSDTAPTAELPPGTDMTNGSANYSGVMPIGWLGGTHVGAYDAKPSDSTYGTFDQTGNMVEWTEGVDGISRVARGGGFPYGNVHSAYRGLANPSQELNNIGFRVADVRLQETVPTVSEWGLIVMALLLLTAIKMVFGRGRMMAASV